MPNRICKPQTHVHPVQRQWTNARRSCLASSSELWSTPYIRYDRTSRLQGFVLPYPYVLGICGSSAGLISRTRSVTNGLYTPSSRMAGQVDSTVFFFFFFCTFAARVSRVWARLTGEGVAIRYARWLRSGVGWSRQVVIPRAVGATVRGVNPTIRCDPWSSGNNAPKSEPPRLPTKNSGLSFCPRLKKVTNEIPLPRIRD